LDGMNLRRQIMHSLVLCTSCGFLLPLFAASPVTADERDRQVLETVLLRLLIDSDFNMTRVTTNRTSIVLNVCTPEKTGMIRPEQMEHDVGEEHSIPKGVQRDLLRRNEKPGTYDSQLASFAGLKFDQRIVVTNVTAVLEGDRFGQAFEQAYPAARAWVEAWLPGYSKDGTRALVRAWIGPSDHGAVVTALLEKKGDKWRIRWQHLARFA